MPTLSQVRAADWRLKFRAVAMPAFSMANVTLLFYAVEMVVQNKKSSSKYSLRQRLADKPLI